MKDYLLIGLVIILVIGALIGLSFGMGWVGVGYTKTVGVAQQSANREVFKENKSYVEGMVSDLAKYKYELATEKDPIARKAIVELIIDKYANFDISKIKDANLVRFLQNVKSGEYNELEEN